jgi:hypothetical protein
MGWRFSGVSVRNRGGGVLEGMASASKALLTANTGPNHAATAAIISSMPTMLSTRRKL